MKRIRFKLGRKGYSLSDMAPIATMFVFVGLALGIGAYVNSEVAETSFTLLSVGCEKVTWGTNATAKTLAYPYIRSVNQMYNSSVCGDISKPNILVGSGNYTNTETFVTLTATGIEMFGSGEKWLNYTTWNTTRYPEMLIVKNSTKSLGDLASWLPIIGVVLAAGIVIGVLVLSFGNRRGI